MKPPKPQTTALLLPSTGKGKLGHITRHVYVATRPCEVEVRSGAGQPPRVEPAWEHIFRCVSTGATRRYGCDDRVEVVN